jgi:dihydroorotate dehydrogenase (NAD+) catalytic subunit
MGGDSLMSNLHKWTFWNREFDSPILLASGTAGFGLELMEQGFLSGAAAVISKATTLKPREGNLPPRIVETRFGLLNSIGLANPGVDEVLKTLLPQAVVLPCPLIINVAGETVEDFPAVIEKLEESPVPFGYEVNVSCPNVAAGGIAFGASPEIVERISALVKSVSSKPFSVKLTPNEGSIVESAKAAEAGGADAVTVCNTFLGMKVDWRTGRALLKRNVGGYSSPALLPLTVARVFITSEAIKIPVLASGGVNRAEDILELLAAGAAMVQVGTWLMRRPDAARELKEGVINLLDSDSP